MGAPLRDASGQLQCDSLGVLISFSICLFSFCFGGGGICMHVCVHALNEALSLVLEVSDLTRCAPGTCLSPCLQFWNKKAHPHT